MHVVTINTHAHSKPTKCFHPPTPAPPDAGRGALQPLPAPIWAVGEHFCREHGADQLSSLRSTGWGGGGFLTTPGTLRGRQRAGRREPDSLAVHPRGSLPAPPLSICKVAAPYQGRQWVSRRRNRARGWEGGPERARRTLGQRRHCLCWAARLSALGPCSTPARPAQGLRMARPGAETGGGALGAFPPQSGQRGARLACGEGGPGAGMFPAPRAPPDKGRGPSHEFRAQYLQPGPLGPPAAKCTAAQAGPRRSGSRGLSTPAVLQSGRSPPHGQGLSQRTLRL